MLAKVGRIVRPEKSNQVYEIYVQEGIIDEIIVSGNAKTKNYVIFRGDGSEAR